MYEHDLVDAQRLFQTGHPLHRRAETSLGSHRLYIRPVLPQDAMPISAFIRRQSPRSRYLRFHAPIVRLTAAQLAAIVDVDHHDRETLVAEIEGRRRRQLVGFAQYVRLGPDRAEAAVSVDDPWQQHGIGHRLMAHLSLAAREAGIVTFMATVLADNQAAVSLARGFHMPVTSVLSGPTYELEVPLLVG
jgi:GNAT superfamily N-acetyltransferase